MALAALAIVALLGLAGVVLLRGNRARTSSLLVAALAVGLIGADLVADLFAPKAMGAGIVRVTDPREWLVPDAVLGYRTNILRLPPAPTTAKHTIHVQLQSGQSLANVSVQLSNFGSLTSTTTVGGFTFTTYCSATSGVTNTNGDFVVYGFMEQDPYVTVSYNDGVFPKFTCFHRIYIYA